MPPELMSGSTVFRDSISKPSPKIDRLVPRVCAATETLARVEARTHLIPVTRVAELTPLDRLRLPVFAAVTPLAKDLTTHLGKGFDAASARASAVMEAVERTCAETTPCAVEYGSFDEIRAAALSAADPTTFDLPSDSTYRSNLTFGWVEGHDLLEDEPVWVLRDLVISPPEEGVLCDVDTNGLATGNTLVEAVLHGLCEVIERDAVGQQLFVDLFACGDDGAPPSRRVDQRTLPDAAASILETISAAGLETVIDDITTEIGVATFRTVIIDPTFPARDGMSVRRFPGYGTDPCADVAVLRSITESVQSRLAVVQGARDSFNQFTRVRRQGHREPAFDDVRPRSMVPMSAVPNFESNDLAADLREVLARLSRAGFRRCFVVDLTQRDLGIPVVRVRVPGLTSFLVNRRRPGWRCIRYLL